MFQPFEEQHRVPALSRYTEAWPDAAHVCVLQSAQQACRAVEAKQEAASDSSCNPRPVMLCAVFQGGWIPGYRFVSRMTPAVSQA
jgi:hypothetical protein